MNWGLSLHINLRGCDYDLITSEKHIKDFIIALCQHLGMKRYGEVLLERFGSKEDKLEGYSAFQFIETSNVAAHFDEVSGRAFIDIFSCKSFNPARAAEFCFTWFNANGIDINTFNRK